MSEELAGGSSAGASDDIATAVSNAFDAADAAGADSSSAQSAPETARTPSPATVGAVVGSGEDAPVGPIPLNRHREIIENTRRKAREEAENELKQRYAWAERYQPDQVQQMHQVWDWMQRDPQQFLQTFQSMLPPQAAAGAQAPAGPPPADYQLADGTSFYSSNQMQAWWEYQAQQLLQKIQQEYGPIRQRVIENETKDKARTEAATIIANARQSWPLFAELEPDMKVILGQSDKVTLHEAYIQAMRERGLKMQEEKIRSEYGAQLQRKADASTPAPRTAPTTPVNRATLDTRELVAMEFERAENAR